MNGGWSKRDIQQWHERVNSEFQEYKDNT